MKPRRFVWSIILPVLGLLAVAIVTAFSASLVHFDQQSRVVRNTNLRVAGLMNSPQQKSPVSFAKAVDYPPGGYFPDFVAVGDLNGDGYLDLVIANQCEIDNCYFGALSVLLGNGDGTFRQASVYGGLAVTSFALGDVNGDGLLDLVVGGSSNVSVMLGNGDGTFQAPILSETGELSAIVIRDLDGDGHPDLTGAAGAGVVGVALGNGDGTFQPELTYSSGGYGPSSVVVADIDGDGHLDMVVSNECVSGCNGYGPGELGVLLGNGDGTFQPVATYASGGLDAESVAVVDLNGDGFPDLVVVNRQACDGCTNGGVAILLGNGDGTFGAAVTYSSGGAGAFALAVSDLNDDGYPDLAVTGTNGKQYANGIVSILLGNGDGTFRTPVSFSTKGADPNSVAIADLDGDHRPDLVVTDYCDGVKRGCFIGYGEVAVLLNNFTSTTKVKVKSTPNPSHVAQSVSFTATISASSSVPDGSMVTFYENGIEIGTGTTSKGVASFTTSFPASGSYAVEASYRGDAFHTASSGTVKQLVKP
jgi:hypothetical protein